jgi:hypothetical protein
MTRRGTPCQASAIWSMRSRRYTRCKNPGGMSTGPKTADDRAYPAGSDEARTIRQEIESCWRVEQRTIRLDENSDGLSARRRVCFERVARSSGQLDFRLGCVRVFPIDFR